METSEPGYASLLLKVRDRDKAATNQLFELLRTELRKNLAWKINNPAVIDDIIQETLLWFLDNHHKVQQAESVVAFVARKAFFLTKNYYISKYSRQMHFVELEENHGMEDPAAAQTESEHKSFVYSKIIEQLRLLPEAYRTILNMHYLEGKSYTEISELLGISYENVKVRTFRGIQMLQKKIRKTETEVSFLLTFI